VPNSEYQTNLLNVSFLKTGIRDDKLNSRNLVSPGNLSATKKAERGDTFEGVVNIFFIKPTPSI
jgi:hypothetical protein